MANHKSAAKRAVTSEKKRMVNKSKLTKVRTVVKKAEATLKTADKAASADAVKAAESALAKGAKDHLVSKKAASRKTSRLVARLKAI